MRAAARNFARAIRRGAADHHAAIGPGRYRATVLSFSSDKKFRLDLHGQDLALDQDDVTLGQTVRSYHARVGIKKDDLLVLVEPTEGDYVAVDVESDTPGTI